MTGYHYSLTAAGMLNYESGLPSNFSDRPLDENSWSVECTTYNQANLDALYITVSVLLNSIGSDRVKVTEL